MRKAKKTRSKSNRINWTKDIALKAIEYLISKNMWKIDTKKEVNIPKIGKVKIGAIYEWASKNFSLNSKKLEYLVNFGDASTDDDLLNLKAAEILYKAECVIKEKGNLKESREQIQTEHMGVVTPSGVTAAARRMRLNSKDLTELAGREYIQVGNRKVWDKEKVLKAVKYLTSVDRFNKDINKKVGIPGIGTYTPKTVSEASKRYIVDENGNYLGREKLLELALKDKIELPIRRIDWTNEKVLQAISYLHSINKFSLWSKEETNIPNIGKIKATRVYSAALLRFQKDGKFIGKQGLIELVESMQEDSSKNMNAYIETRRTEIEEHYNERIESETNPKKSIILERARNRELSMLEELLETYKPETLKIAS